MVIHNLSELLKFASSAGADDVPGLNLRFTFYKNEIYGGGTSFMVTTANQWLSWWQLHGSPGHGVSPGYAFTTPDNTTAGAVPLPDLLGTAYQLVHFSSQGATIGELMLYDRIAHVGGIDATFTSSVSLVGFYPARYTGLASDGLELYVEIYTQIGATPQTLTVAYFDQDSTLQFTACTIGGTGAREVGAMIPVPIARVGNGMLGLVASQLAGSTGTTGEYGFTLVKPLSRIETVATANDYRSTTRGLDEAREVKDGACLALMQKSMLGAGNVRSSGTIAIIEEQ